MSFKPVWILYVLVSIFRFTHFFFLADKLLLLYTVIYVYAYLSRPGLMDKGYSNSVCLLYSKKLVLGLGCRIPEDFFGREVRELPVK